MHYPLYGSDGIRHMIIDHVACYVEQEGYFMPYHHGCGLLAGCPLNMMVTRLAWIASQVCIFNLLLYRK